MNRPASPTGTRWTVRSDCGPPVDLHINRLDVPDGEIEVLNGWLSPEERARANRFRPADAARRFRVARGHLRRILAAYIRQPPETIRFETTAHGKLELETAQNPDGVRFNLSHCGDLSTVAVCFVRPVGVDIEFVRPIDNLCEIAERYFPPEEANRIRECDEPERTELFFRAWTRMEACLKAAGAGLAGWQALAVNLESILTMKEFEPAQGFVGCVVCLTG